MSETFLRTYTLDDGETEVEVEITVSSWGSPAHYGSPTYPGHPAEGPECEITNAWLLEDAEPRPSILSSLTDAERERMERAFLEDPPEPDYDDD